MSTAIATRPARILPLRIEDVPGVDVLPAAEPAPEPPHGFLDRLVAAARLVDPGAYAVALPADFVSPMTLRIRERLDVLAAQLLAETRASMRAPAALLDDDDAD